MSNWIKFTHNNLEAFGIISGSEVDVYDGDMFDNPVSYTHLRAHETR